MDEYIRRQDAFNAVEARIAELMTHPEFQRKHLDIDLSGVIRNIASIPPADVVSVVRCRDCAGCEYDTALDQYWCTRGRLIIGRHVMPDDFCSYGERREE